ncbi:Heme-degrading monooxygenase HmoA [Mariprofundus ferrinatatus]|uniref:Heme-degrading monooxygenase HmoA n=1 Tax=Mariprofundus ferrinatatus TaxID=1921087 RepID=A0A2K8L540_9PROT|nr:antibiotic biosynthesis monooxygenase [Mariprofundus ferrinatatus]ATX82430.1 Heme-degrading monooxygenase HmoA [Mariprofundus ferrinatatus]
MFVTMNRFTIDPEHWPAFEARFRERAGLVDGEPGFIRNAVLRPESDTTNQHVVMTMWESRSAFEAWTRSEAFRKAHEKAGQTPPAWFIAPSKLEMFESVTDSGG